MPDGSLKPVPAEQLPVLLPSALPGPDSSNTELAPLGRAKSWVMTTDPETGSPARRETNTMPQWAGSSWYYLRFVDPANDQAPWSPEAERRWLPVDLYVGGAEHATLHLLYARFWHKFLFDLGYVSTPEPFQRLFNQGMVHSRSFRDDRGKYYYSSEVFERDGEWFVRETNRPLKSRVEKMSKSRNNGISPEEVVVENGADSLRIYEVFMGPLEESVIWQTDGVIGVRRFLDRVWRLFVRAGESDCLLSKTDRAELEQHLHQTVRKVTEDIQKLQLNTAVSQLMIFVNQATRKPGVPREILNAFVRLLAPFAPHLAEELWQALGHEDTIAFAPWPNYDPLKCASESVRIAIQVNGRLRGRLDLPRGCAEAQAYAAARENSTISRYLQGQQIAKTVFVADRLLNIITTSVSAG